jgi:hypothetical protein
MSTPLDRRRFLQKSALLGAAAAGLSFSANAPEPQGDGPWPAIPDLEMDDVAPTVPYPANKPNVILIRFGGGVRRLETILDPEHTYCPFIYHELYKKHGVCFPNVEIDSSRGIETSHGQGTLYIMTGRFAHYADIESKPLSDRFVPVVPTIFEYFRHTYVVPEHQSLIINGEDRINEDFYTFSNCRPYGIAYRSTVLSLFRYKQFLLRDALEQDRQGLAPLSAAERNEKTRKLAEMNHRDYRRGPNNEPIVNPVLDDFWREWRSYYGTTGLVNPRKDRLLTALTLRALARLKPRLLMINYQDPDYVHWGNRSFYTRAISIIDEGVREIYSAVQADEFYRNNTVFVIVPDCGRDSNRCMPVPFQHHFNSRSSREIFAVASGPGIVHGGVSVRRSSPHQQISVAGTIGKIMGFPTPRVDAGAWVLEEMFA